MYFASKILFYYTVSIIQYPKFARGTAVTCMYYKRPKSLHTQHKHSI